MEFILLIHAFILGTCPQVNPVFASLYNMDFELDSTDTQPINWKCKEFGYEFVLDSMPLLLI